MNLAAEARALVQAKYPGAAVIERGRGFICHQHPTDPGREIFQTQVGPMHYGAGNDQEIDTAWVADTTDGFTHAMTANDFVTRVRGDQFNAGNIFRFEKDGETLAFDPQSINWIDENTSRQQIAIKQNVAGTFNDDTVLFTGAYGSGIDFSYQNQTAKLQKLIIIDDFATLPAPTVQGNDVLFEAEFSLSLSSGINFWIDGVEWSRSNNVRVQTVDRIEVRTSDGSTVLWHLDYPRANDSSGNNEAIGQLEVRRQGGPSSLFICVRIPYDWMAAASYPIEIDPTVDAQVGASADDASQNGSTVSITGSNVTVNTTSLHCGARWQLAIPNGATIDVSYASYYSLNANRPVDYTMSIQDADTAAAFTTTNDDITDRTAHATTVDWNNGGVNAGSGEWIDTDSLNTPIEAVIGRAGWSSGNYLCGYYTERSGGAAGMNVRLYDGDSSNAPKLHVEYSTGGGPTGSPWYTYAQQ